MEKVNVAVISSSDEAVNPTTQLTLSFGDFQEMVELSDRDESWLRKPIFPQDKTLALLALLAYKDDLHQTMFSSDNEEAISTYEQSLLTKFSSSNKALDRVTLDGYQQNLIKSLKEISEEWQLLTTARNESDGYFGAAFWNSGNQQLVLSHRGTNPKNISALLADIEGVMRNQHTSQMDSACTFVEHVLRELSHKKRFKQIQISITGHSLGAWLAQVTAFSTEYLTIDREVNKFRLKSEEDQAYHAHMVGFESPGCRRMLTKLCEMFHRRYENLDHNFWTELDITLYLTRPNMVNTCCKHVGKLFQLDIPPFLKDNCWLKVTHYTYYIIHYHSMKNIVMAQSNSNRVKMIHDWPLVIFANRTKDDGCKPSKYLDYTFVKLIKSLPSLIYDYIAKSNQEVNEFWAQSSDENDYSPEHDKNIEGGIRLHYKVGDIAPSLCHLSTFSKVEQLFLFCWPNETTLRFNMKEEIKKELPKFKLDEHDCLFENFLYIENDCKQLKCDNVKVDEVINFTKQLFRFINEPRNFIQKLTRISQTNVSICKKFSQSYVKQMIVEGLDFTDTIGLGEYLSENEFNELLMIKSRFKFEIQRVYCILKLNKQKCIFLDLRQLTHLNNYLYLSETIKSVTDHVLVLDCQREENLNEKQLNLIRNLLENIKTLPTLIMIIRNDSAENTIKNVCKQNVKFVERNDQLYFNDLTEDSKQWLKNVIKDKIMLQGKKIDLLNFIGQFEALDGDLVAELLKKNKILEIGSEPMKLCQSEASYAKRLKFIQVERLIQAFKDDSNERKNEIFLITSCNEINFEAFFHLLRIDEDEIERQNIRERSKILHLENENIDYNMCQKISILNKGKETHFKSFCYHNSEKVVYWLEIVNENFFLHQIFDTDFYVKRHLHHRKSIKNDVISDLKAKEKFVINVSNSREAAHFLKDEENPNIYISVKEDKALNQFNDWCDDTAVHLLKVNDNRLIWQQSHFSISKLRNYLDASNKQEIDEQALANLNNRVVIIVAEPGMGKSTTLTRLSEYKLKDNWVIRLNLKDHLEQIFNLPDDYAKDIDNANRVIVKFLMNVSHNSCKLTEILLKYSLDHSKSLSLLLLFDGYDEIDESHQRKLIRLLRYSKIRNIAKLWVSSRQEFTQVLEDQLCVFSTTFKELTVDERADFLKYFWQVRLKLELSETEYEMAFGNSVESNKFKIFSSALLEKVDKVLDERMSKFMGIPLQMRLLAENFLPDFQDFIKSRSKKKVPQFRELNVTQIYQRFIKVKFDIYFEEKSRLSIGLNELLTKWFSDDLIKRHQFIAFQILFPDQSKHLLEMDSSSSEKDLAIDGNVEIGLKRVGLVHSPDPYSGQLEFIHRTFAEYFVSTLLLNWLRKPLHPKIFEIIDCLLKVIFKKFEVICSFLNEQISETDVSTIKAGCFGRNIFDYLDIVCENNHVNLIKCVLSFFKNKIWILKECKFEKFFSFALKSKNSEILKCFLTLTANHYDILNKLLFRPSYCIENHKYTFKNNPDSIFKKMEGSEGEKFRWENAKNLLSSLRFRTKFIENLVQDYYLPDLLETFRGEEELREFMLRLKSGKVVEEDEINRLVNRVRDKNVGNENDIERIISILEHSYTKGDGNFERRCEGEMRFLYDFKNLISEDKPRRIIRKFQFLYRTFSDMNKLASTVEKMREANFQMEIVPKNEDELVPNGSYYWDSFNCLKRFKYEKDLCKFLIVLKNDEEFRRLLKLLEDFSQKNCIILINEDEIESIDNDLIDVDDHEIAIKIINERVDSPKLFLSLKYFNHKIKPILFEILNDDEQQTWQLFRPNVWFRKDFHIFISDLQTSYQWFSNGIECSETKELLSHFLPILTLADFILAEKNIEKLCPILWKHCLKQNSNEDESEKIVINDVEILKSLFRLLVIRNQKQFFATVGKMNIAYVERVLLASLSFPGIFLLFIFKLFRAKHLMFTTFSEQKVYLILELAWKSYPRIVQCLLASISPNQNNHLIYLLKNNYTKVISLIVKILKSFPHILGYLILFQKEKCESCLHFAIVECELETLEHFLSELRRKAPALRYVIEHFGPNHEEEKLSFFEVAEMNNPGALSRFLNSLKIDDELLKKFLFPNDKSSKPVLYLAAEKGRKDVMDTLLSVLKSEPDTLWELVVWADHMTGQTLLHRACDRGYVEIAEAVLESMKNEPKKIKMLIEMKDKFEHGVLDCAILSERQIISNDFHKKLRRDFIDSINYKILKNNFQNESCWGEKPIESLLKLSFYLRNMPMVVRLILVMAKSFDNVELMLALFDNEELKLVLESMFITLDGYSYRLFRSAIERNSLELVKDLMEKGVNVNCANGYGATPLMRAVQKCRLEIAELLMKSGGPDVYETDMNGNSAYSLANDEKNKKKT